MQEKLESGGVSARMLPSNFFMHADRFNRIHFPKIGFHWCSVC